MSGDKRRPYCPECGSKNVEMTGLEWGFIAPGEHENDVLDSMTYVKCKDCGWEGKRIDCKKEKEFILLSDEFFEAKGFEKVTNIGEESWRLQCENADYSILMTHNNYDNSWTYSDYRNKVYGLYKVKELNSLLAILHLTLE